MKALLIVDLQNDFCEGGALEVKSSLNIIPVINQYISFFESSKYPVIASRDWHPASTAHFKKFGGIWPVHCVENTLGAAFHSDLILSHDAIIISKGMGNEDAFSAFNTQNQDKDTLKVILKKLFVSDLYICGLATDYCVKETVIDALRLGFNVYLLTDAIKGVDINSGDSESAIKQMLSVGAEPLTLERLKIS